MRNPHPRGRLAPRGGFVAALVLALFAAGCSTGGAPKSGAAASDSRGAAPSDDASRDADELGSVDVARLPDPNPVRLVWEDFHRRGSRIALVSPGFDGAGLKLETGRLEPATKVLDPQILAELVVFMKSEGFFDRATEVDPRSAVSVDAGVKAAITLERAGKRLSIFHVLGSGETKGGQSAVDSFVTIKKAILAVYNATTQYTGIVERR
jgi:hypothetical protein